MAKENFEAQKETENAFLQQSYREFMSAIEQVPDLRISTSKKASIAWLIERVKQENPQDWQTKVQEMKETVETLNKKGGKFEVSHFLGREINNRYTAFLKERIQRETDEQIKKNLKTMIKMTEDNSQFAQKAREQNETVSFGGVSLDYTPDWYYEI